MIINHLDQLLKDRQITPEKLHEKTRVSKATIRSLLTNKAHHIDFDELEGLCDFLNCAVGELLEHSTP